MFVERRETEAHVGRVGEREVGVHGSDQHCSAAHHHRDGEDAHGDGENDKHGARLMREKVAVDLLPARTDGAHLQDIVLRRT